MEVSGIRSAMILAAGVGSRLRPLTSWRAKALMPIGDRPALAHLALHLRAAGVERIVVNAHHRSGEISAFVRDSRGELGEIALSEERDLLGTAGGLSNARALLGDGDTLVWNGDIVANVDVSELGRAHATKNALATLAVKFTDKNRGNVGIGASGKIVRLRNETTSDGEIAGGFFIGVHLIGQALRDLLPKVGCLVGDVYLPALRCGASLFAHPFDAEFSDIGTPASYLDANLAWLRARGEASWRGDRAIIADAVKLCDSIVGVDSIVTGVGRVDACVIWPGALLEAPLSSSIVTPFGTVGV